MRDEAAVGNGSQWGFIDTHGDLVIPQQFADAGYFTNAGTYIVSVLEGQYNMLRLKFVD